MEVEFGTASYDGIVIVLQAAWFAWGDVLAAAKRAIEALSGIVDDLTLMVERKTQEMSRNAA